MLDAETRVGDIKEHGSVAKMVGGDTAVTGEPPGSVLER